MAIAPLGLHSSSFILSTGSIGNGTNVGASRCSRSSASLDVPGRAVAYLRMVRLASKGLSPLRRSNNICIFPETPQEGLKHVHRPFVLSIAKAGESVLLWNGHKHRR